MTNTEPQRDNNNVQNETNTQPDIELEEGSFAEQVDADSQLEEALNAASSDDSDPVSLSGEENPLQIRITALESELSSAKEQTLRALAELENYRKRATREREDAGKYAVSKFSRDLLGVADNLRRALDAFPEESKQDIKVANLLDGIEATEKDMLKTFDKNGIKKIEPLDEPFDPNFHEVMFETPVADKAHGTVIQVIEPGYTLNDRILRPARVGIAKNDSAQSKDAPDASPGGTIDTEA